MNVSSISGVPLSLSPVTPRLPAPSVSPSSIVGISSEGMRWLGLYNISEVIMALLILALLK